MNSSISCFPLDGDDNDDYSTQCYRVPYNGSVGSSILSFHTASFTTNAGASLPEDLFTYYIPYGAIVGDDAEKSALQHETKKVPLSAPLPSLGEFEANRTNLVSSTISSSSNSNFDQDELIADYQTLAVSSCHDDETHCTLEDDLHEEATLLLTPCTDTKAGTSLQLEEANEYAPTGLVATLLEDVDGDIDSKILFDLSVLLEAAHAPSFEDFDDGSFFDCGGSMFCNDSIHVTIARRQRQEAVCESRHEQKSE